MEASLKNMKNIHPTKHATLIPNAYLHIYLHFFVMKTSLAGSCDTEVAALFAHLFMESCSIAFAIQAGQGQALRP